MAKKKSRQQEKAIQKIRDSQGPVYILIAMAIFASLLILSSAEHPKLWKTKDITVRDVSFVYISRGSYYQITDDTGFTYSIDSGNKMAEKLVPGATYHIMYASIHHNRIKYMTDSNTEYVSYEASVQDFYIRTIAGAAGILLSCAVIVLIRCQTSKEIRKIRGNCSD